MNKSITNTDQPPKLDRKTIERNRRIQMKNLCSQLTSLIPPHKGILSQANQLHHATSYINELKHRIENLKTMKEQLVKPVERKRGTSSSTTLPVFELRDLGSSIEVVLISGLQKNFMFHEVIHVLEEEGAEVVSTNFLTVGDKIYHTIHAQVKISRVGVETTRVLERLKDLGSQVRVCKG